MWCIKPGKYRDKLPINLNWFRMSSINSTNKETMQFGRWPTISSNQDEIYLKGRVKKCYIHGPCNTDLEQQHIKIYPQCTIYTSTSQIYWQILWMLFHINQWMKHHYFNIICHMLRIASCHRLPSSPISGCKPNPPPMIKVHCFRSSPNLSRTHRYQPRTRPYLSPSGEVETNISPL